MLFNTYGPKGSNAKFKAIYQTISSSKGSRPTSHQKGKKSISQSSAKNEPPKGQSKALRNSEAKTDIKQNPFKDNHKGSMHLLPSHLGMLKMFNWTV